MGFSKPKGTYDLLPSESGKWGYVEHLFREVCRVHNFKEVRTPMFEASNLYHRAAGETSDVVSKETYDFEDRGGRSVTLRPEGTAGVVRSFVENKLYVNQAVQKMFYMGPMFRYERQQKGRYRQHIQFGVEAFGSDDAMLDVEIIAMAHFMIDVAGVRNTKVKINSLGGEECRAAYREALITYLSGCKDELCEDCQARYERNPLRILDCKRDSGSRALAEAPKIIDYLTSDERKFFDDVRKGLASLDVPYEYDANLVRGFDYYTNTIFEIQADIPGFGAQSTLCGGGRYNKLVEELGGPSTPAIGFGMGLERLMLALEAEGVDVPSINKLDVFFVAMGSKAKMELAGIMAEVRGVGISCDMDYSDRKLKSKLKLADDSGARYRIVVGDDEIESGRLNLYDMKLDVEEEVPLLNLPITLYERIEANMELEGTFDEMRAGEMNLGDITLKIVEADLELANQFDFEDDEQD